ncbi:MAG: CopD family protein [Anaerolineae bacterium]|nr:CopD family protein [Anaerolineae bacterium]
MIDWLLVISLFLHLLATAIWLGGLILASILIMPEARKRMAAITGLVEFLDRLRARFDPLANLSLVTLVVTGLYQMTRDPNYEGFLAVNNDWSRAILLKHIAVIGMVLVGGIMQFGIVPAIERAKLYASQGKTLPNYDVQSLRRRERRFIVLNTVLGVVVLLCTAVATAL